MRRKLFLPFIAVVVFTTAACTPTSTSTGSNTSSPTPTQNSETETEVVADACTVFKVEDLNVAVGVTFNAGNPGPATKTLDGLPFVQCKWEEGEGRFEEYTIDLNVRNYSSIANAEREMNNNRVDFGSITHTELDGLGDEAIALDKKKTGKDIQVMIYWRKGMTVYNMGILKTDGLNYETGLGDLKEIVNSNALF